MLEVKKERGVTLQSDMRITSGRQDARADGLAAAVSIMLCICSSESTFPRNTVGTIAEKCEQEMQRTSEQHM